MNPNTRVLLVNLSIVAGLVVSYLTSQPVGIIIIVGALLLAMANILMYFKYEKKDQAEASPHIDATCSFPLY
jgi:hypothetical protein